MAKKTLLKRLYPKKAAVFLNHVIEDKPLLPFMIPLILLAWAVERFIVPFSNWVPLVVAVWATIEYSRYQRLLLVEDLNRKWKQLVLNTSHVTPIEPCEWLNKLLLEVWPNYMEPKLSTRFSSTVERRLKHRKPKLLETVQLQEFSLGSCPPILGLQGAQWLASGDQQVLQMGFDWVTNELSILLFAKLAKPLRGTARIVINSIHIKGKLLLMPILDGQAVLYSFESSPDVQIGVAFGSGGSQTLPATELPGVSSWLVKLCTETLAKQMVEPRRLCFSLPSVDLRRKAVSCILYVTVVSANNLVGSNVNIASGSRQHLDAHGNFEGGSRHGNLQTFVEVEIEELSRRTSVQQGSEPVWNDTFNMLLHGESGILKINLYEWISNSVKFNYLTSCEIKMKYVSDGSTTFWAIGPRSGIVAAQAQYCGKEVELTVPFEGNDQGELTVKLSPKEWQFSDGSNTLRSSSSSRPQQAVHVSPSIQVKTGRKIKVTVLEGANLVSKSGKSEAYVKLHYGKALHKTKTVSHSSVSVWNETFEFDEIGDGDYLKLRCYNAEMLGDEFIGSARLSIDGISDNARTVCIPLEKVNSGELKLRIEVKNDETAPSRNSLKANGNGWIELVIIEAKELVAADLRGTSDPYVRVQYGTIKKRTKVIYKTLNPHWNQTLEFPDTRSPLILHVKDHNAVLPTASIGQCVVEYENLPPNEVADKWIPLQGVKTGEIHIKITRKFPELEKKSSLDNDVSSHSKASQTSGQIRDLLKKLRSSSEDGDLEGLPLLVTEIETAEFLQWDYILQLEKEQRLLLTKIEELGREISKVGNGSVKK